MVHFLSAISRIVTERVLVLEILWACWMTSHPSIAAPLPVVLAISAALLVAYVAGYLWLGQLTTTNQGIADLNGAAAIHRD